MGFHTHATHGATGYTGIHAPAQANACTCRTHPPARRKTDQGSDLVSAMMALVINSKIDKTLEGVAPLHAHATDAPLLPRGMMEAARQRHAADNATGPLPAPGLMTAARRQDAPEQSRDAPLRPRGLMTKGGR